MTMQSLSTTTTELKPVELQSYLDEGWRIFVDTCSFMRAVLHPKRRSLQGRRREHPLSEGGAKRA